MRAAKKGWWDWEREEPGEVWSRQFGNLKKKSWHTFCGGERLSRIQDPSVESGAHLLRKPLAGFQLLVGVEIQIARARAGGRKVLSLVWLRPCVDLVDRHASNPMVSILIFWRPDYPRTRALSVQSRSVALHMPWIREVNAGKRIFDEATALTDTGRGTVRDIRSSQVPLVTTLLF